MSGPIAFPPKNHLDRLTRIYEDGLPSGAKTGWVSLDRHYRPLPGQFTIVSGYPGSGKSEFIDALFLNLAKTGWRFAIFSPENVPTDFHVIKYLEKHTGKPFNPGPTVRMTIDEMEEATREISDWFGFMRPNPFTPNKEIFGVEEVLEAAETWMVREGYLRSENPCGLLIDPWNELEHWRPNNLSETEYVSATLSKVRHWARNYNVHVWLVAHPQKLRRDDQGHLPVPRPDNALGSVHFWNKADNFITVHRDQGSQKDEVEIHVQKVRFKHLGRPGLVELRWDRVTGRYFDVPAEVLRRAGGRDG